MIFAGRMAKLNESFYPELINMDLKANVSTSLWPDKEIDSSKFKEAKGAENDFALWNDFLKGDESAFISIYQRYAETLFNFGCQFTPDRDMVMDCLQDFFIYLRNKRDKLGRTDAIKPYLFKAFKRRLVDYIKKQKKVSTGIVEDAFRQFPVELSHEAIFIHQQMEKEQIHKLNSALNQLDSKEREAIYYFYYEGLGYAEIAEIFGFSHVSSARRLVYRGLAHLRKILTACILMLMLDLQHT